MVYLGWGETAQGLKGKSRVNEYAQRLHAADKGLAIILHMMSLFALFRQYHIHLLGIPAHTAGGPNESAGPAVEVPWIFLGPRIKEGHLISSRISLLDTVPTIAKLLNLPLLSAWDGTPVEDIFVDQPREPQNIGKKEAELSCALTQCVVRPSVCSCQNVFLPC